MAKIGLENDAKHEYRITSRIRKSIDSSGSFGVYAKRLYCKGAKERLQRERLSSTSRTCKDLQKTNSNICAVTFDRYDYTLESLLKTPNIISKSSWILYTLNLWTGLDLLHKRKIVHGDIKDSNIAFDFKRGLRFTDWDWSKKLVTCQDVIDQMTSIFYNGRDYEEWAPILRKLKEPICDFKLLYFNDVYGLCRLTKKICKKANLSEEAYTACSKIIKYQNRNVSAHDVYVLLSGIFSSK